MRKFILLAAFLLSAEAVYAQGGHVDGSALRPTASIPGATVRVCTEGSTGTPCLILASIYTDKALSNAKANPFSADSVGNFDFYAATGCYKVQVSATGFSTVTYAACADVNPSANNAFTGFNTFSQQIVSTVATGTAPLSIVSTTLVPNLNSALHGGLAAPSSAILGLTDSQAPTNKTINVSTNSIVETTPSAGKYLRDNGTSFQPSSVAAAGAGGCGANNFVTGANDNAAPTCAQPAFSNLSGTATTAQIGTGTPAGSKYVDGGTGAWTALPAGGPTVTAVDLTLQGADIAATTLLTPGANGFFRMEVWSEVTRVATTSSTLPTVNVIFTDAETSLSITLPVASSNTGNTTSTKGPYSASSVIAAATFYAKSGVAIQYSTSGYASVGATSMQYALHLRLTGPY